VKGPKRTYLAISHSSVPERLTILAWLRLPNRPPLNALNSKQKDNCNAKLGARGRATGARDKETCIPVDGECRLEDARATAGWRKLSFASAKAPVQGGAAGGAAMRIIQNLPA